MTEASVDNAIADILDAVRSDRLLRGAATLSRDHVDVVASFDDAIDHAWRRTLTDGDDDDALTWRDLRANEAARLLGLTYSAADMGPIRTAIRVLGQRFADLLRLPDEYACAFDDVIGDLQNIALGRVVEPDANGLFPRLWHVYRQGGWPCGWRGRYPAGRLVAFAP